MIRKLSLLLALFVVGAAAKVRLNELDRHVYTPDPAFQWKKAVTRQVDNVTMDVIEMTSQQFLSPAEVNRHLWQHQVIIIRPKEIKHSTGFLWIDGGSNPGRLPDRPDPIMAETARATGSVVALVRMVPNEPLRFTGESKDRTEDGIIVLTWRKWMEGDKKYLPLHLPMAKAAVRAMDVVQEFCKSENVKVEKFVVGGGSKRGWTTWLAAAAEAARSDSRVAAIVPAVIDVLNMEPNFVHHFRAYGFWAPAIGDYEKEGIMEWRGSKEYAALQKVEDPYWYRDRLTMPKYIVNAAGDQFFLPDSSQFYWKDLKGPKLLRYIPNADHSMRNSDAPQSLAAWQDVIANRKPLPRYDWKIQKDTMVVTSPDKPKAVKLWQATNPDKRDFRLMTIGPAYKSSDLQETKPGVWQVKLDKPPKGWTAYLVELTFDVGAKYPLKTTTQVKVVPDVYPAVAPKGTKGTR
jgi:PhoPQ-activated pathogenicity-related protein